METILFPLIVFIPNFSQLFAEINGWKMDMKIQIEIWFVLEWLGKLKMCPEETGVQYFQCYFKMYKYPSIF